MGEDVLRQVLEAVETAQDRLNYAEFCRRLGLKSNVRRPDGLLPSQLWESWRRLRQPLADFTSAELAQLLADTRPWSAAEIERQEG